MCSRTGRGGGGHQLEAQGYHVDRPADVLIHHGQDGYPVAVDFTVVHPSPPSAFPLTPLPDPVASCSRAIARAEEAQVAKHTPSCKTMG